MPQADMTEKLLEVMMNTETNTEFLEKIKKLLDEEKF
jgi:transcription termination factor Rho